MSRPDAPERILCWRHFDCGDVDCPVHGTDELCWQTEGAHCRTEVLDELRDKLELCCACEVFKRSIDPESLDATFDQIAQQLRRYRLLVEDRDRELKGVSMELAIGVSEVLDALVRVADGEHEARVAGSSSIELLEQLKKVTNRTIEALVQEMVDRQRTAEERQHLESALQQAQKMEALGRLAGGVAHDFNNMLTVINNSAGLVARRLPAGDPLGRTVGAIAQAGERAASLVRRLLAFSRSSLTEPEVICPSDVLTGMADMLDKLLDEDVELTLALAPETGSVRADRGQIEQVMLNLAVNARDAMDNGGSLAIETANVTLDAGHRWLPVLAKEGRYVMLCMSDTGRGMDEQTQARMFEPFFTTKEIGKGTGLGLTMVHGIVSRSDGHVCVESEVGRGTTFRIFLPEVQQVVRAETLAPVEEAATSGATVLVVEDNVMVRRLVEEVLREEGYQVVAAAEATEAIEVCQQRAGPIHLMLTDVVMPKVSGCELAARVASIRPDMKVIFMSGYADSAVAQRGVRPSDGHFLPKPFKTEALVDMIRKVIAERA